MKKQAVLSLSGGMDSSTLLLHLLANGYEVTALSFDYGQKHKVELERAQALVDYLNSVDKKIKYQIIRLDGLSKLLNSALVTGGAEVPEGHYAEEEPGLKIIEEGKEHDANLYSLCNDENEIKPKVAKTDDYPFIVNHTKKQFVDKNKVPEIQDWEGVKIHPLPLLTSEGNGQGGGDFRGEDENEIIGSWARDVISIEKESPLVMIGTTDYTELIFDLKE